MTPVVLSSDDTPADTLALAVATCEAMGTRLRAAWHTRQSSARPAIEMTWARDVDRSRTHQR